MRCHQRVNLRRGPPCLTCRHPIFYCHALKRFTYLQNWDKKILAKLKSFKAPMKLEDMIQQGLYVKCAQACRVYFHEVQIMGLLYLFCGLSYLHQHEKEQRQNQNLVKIMGIYIKIRDIHILLVNFNYIKTINYICILWRQFRE